MIDISGITERDQNGNSISQLAERSPLLLVFLRHFG